MEGISVSMKRILQSLGNGDFHNIEVMGYLLLIFIFIIAVSLFWFAYRGLKLWKEKSKLEVNLLTSIDGRLQNMEENMIGKSQQDNSVKSTEPMNPDDEDMVIVPGGDKHTVSRHSTISNIGRNGRVYSKEEIELQIRD
ncbi:hypothetical protein [Sinanaerobacter chloroacetimidivorans]|jgi:cell division protein FtsL|uniref:Uncharacterized protein n=1 Tax=Sinanaerobacter chloroacetimidivorans TaxID=2818044 RepID=A0A8J7W233_9FIRM|nr:hypothetical protein [Sinanaerobacter chloroacetimidivorans]MBR0597825.1 hypothetical protein [Sinanaerobacter chloroacetimidivorans]